MQDTLLLSYAMEAVLDTGFSLSYHDQVLHKLLPLSLSPTTESKSPHVHALTRLLVTLSNASLTVPLLTLLVRHEKLLAYQFALDLVEGGTRDFLDNIRNEPPEGSKRSTNAHRILSSYAMEAVLDTGFSLSYHDQVLHILLPLFLSPTTESKSPHVHALTRLLVTLSNASLTVPLLTLLVRHEKLLVYQFALDLVEGGARDFLDNIRNELPEGSKRSTNAHRILSSCHTQWRQC
jgi:hypothetical protein